MMKRQKWLAALLMCCCIAVLFVSGSEAVNAKRRKAFKNAPPPPGWQYEMGYTLWRLEKGLPVSAVNWKHYVREKKWRQQRGKETFSEKIVLNSLDWTIEELASFLKEQDAFLRPQPAGLEP